MTKPEIDWWKRTGGVASTIILVATIVGWLWSWAFSAATAPITASIMAETSARALADERMVDRLRTISRDRLDLLDILTTPAGSARDRKMSLIREKWSLEELHAGKGVP